MNVSSFFSNLGSSGLAPSMLPEGDEADCLTVLLALRFGIENRSPTKMS